MQRLPKLLKFIGGVLFLLDCGCHYPLGSLECSGKCLKLHYGRETKREGRIKIQFCFPVNSLSSSVSELCLT